MSNWSSVEKIDNQDYHEGNIITFSWYEPDLDNLWDTEVPNDSSVFYTNNDKLSAPENQTGKELTRPIKKQKTNKKKPRVPEMNQGTSKKDLNKGQKKPRRPKEKTSEEPSIFNESSAINESLVINESSLFNESNPQENVDDIDSNEELRKKRKFEEEIQICNDYSRESSLHGFK